MCEELAEQREAYLKASRSGRKYKKNGNVGMEMFYPTNEIFEQESSADRRRKIPTKAKYCPVCRDGALFAVRLHRMRQGTGVVQYVCDHCRCLHTVKVDQTV